MAQKLTDGAVRALPGPAASMRITWDSEVRGFGCRVTKGGAKAFVLNYRHGGISGSLRLGLSLTGASRRRATKRLP